MREEKQADYFPASKEDLGSLGDDWGPKLPPGRDPLGQSQDNNWPFLDWYRIGALSEAMVDSHPPVRAAMDRLIELVVGEGFNINPNTGDQKLDDDLEEYYLSISVDARRIDYDEESDLKGILKKLLRGSLISGGIFANFVNRKDTRDNVGKVQLIESYRCKTPWDKGEENGIVGGIQLAPNSRRQIGYWFEPDDIGWEQFIRPASETLTYFPAEDNDGNKTIIHFRRPDRPSGTKSTGVLACGLESIFQHRRLRFNVCTKAEIINAVALIKEVDPDADDDLKKALNERLKEKNGYFRGLGFKPGQTILSPAGMRARIEAPNLPNQEYFTLDDVLLMELSALFWIQLAVLRLDASLANFSSMRAMMKVSEPGFRSFQNNLTGGFLRHFWDFSLRDLTVTDAPLRNALKRRKYNPHQAIWDPPGWASLDPEKDAECDNIRMSNGHASDSRVFQERGLNFTKEAPRIVSDAAWRMELVLDQVLQPAFRKKYESAGVTSREAFIYLYGRTTPNGQKLSDSVAKANGAILSTEIAETEQDTDET